MCRFSASIWSLVRSRRSSRTSGRRWWLRRRRGWPDARIGAEPGDCPTPVSGSAPRRGTMFSGMPKSSQLTITVTPELEAFIREAHRVDSTRRICPSSGSRTAADTRRRVRGRATGRGRSWPGTMTSDRQGQRSGSLGVAWRTQRRGTAQSSHFRPATRTNSFALDVTSVAPRRRA